MGTRINLKRCFNPKRFLFAFGGVAGGLLLAVAIWASIPPTAAGLLELDGNVIVNNAGSDDWNTINLTGSSGSNRGNSVVNTFVAGPSSPETFATGGSKDPLDITNWKWTTGSVPAKDQLTNGYAAAYNSATTNNELVLYAGADRYAQNGDSNIGVWFFQQQVGPCPDATNAGCAGRPDGSFSGQHVDHDIFIVSAFTAGGGTSTISVYEWNHTLCASGPFPSNPTVGQCADSNLRVIFSSSTVCGTTDACAFVNSALLSGANAPTWAYTPKSGTAGTFPPGAFYEAGINLTQLLSPFVANLPCFTSFLEETRSSQSTSAVLKDFIGHSFPLCGIHVTKECPTCSITGGGTTFTYNVDGTVENTGVGSLFNVTVTDSNIATAFSCGTLAAKGQAGSSKKWGSTAGAGDCTGTSSSFTSTANPATNQATASGQTASTGGTTISDTTAVITCGVCTPAPGIALTKNCSTTPVLHNGEVAIRVDYNGTVQNTSANTGLNSVFVSEDDNNDGTVDVSALVLQPLDNLGNPVGGTCTSCSLSPGQTASFASSYFPNAIHVVNPGRGDFTDKVQGGGDSAIVSPNCTPTAANNFCHPHVAATPVTATCPICPPNSATCTP